MGIAFMLAFQFIAPISIGILITSYLRTVMRRLLIDLCGTPERADFWVRVSAVMTTTAPLVMVLIGSASPLTCVAGDAICAVGVLRDTSVLMLFGMLVAVGGIAGVIAMQIPARPKTGAGPKAAV